MTQTLREKALRLLARREHSRAELARKLAVDASAPEAINPLLDALESKNLLSDKRYAEQRVAARAARHGNARLARDLRDGGADAETIEAALKDAGDEASRLRTVWQKKFGVAPASQKDWARQARFLQGRGFSPELIRALLSAPPDSD
jgi:regulatory protein